MATQGPNNGGTAVSDTGNPVGSTGAWSNPSNALIDDAFYATFGPSAIDDITEYLKVTNFGFTIPGGATINGIVVEFKRKTSTASVPIDYSIKIVKAGTIGGNEQSAGAAWSTTEGYVSFGSSSDLWGLAWGPSDINSSGFGVVIAAQDPSVSGWTASINHVRITITYTVASTAYTLTLLGVGT